MNAMCFFSSRSLRFCLVLVFACRGGKAFTVRADKLTLGNSVARGGAARKSRPAAAEKLAVTSPDKITLEDVDADSRGPLKVLFLSADTGGGHRGTLFFGRLKYWSLSITKAFLLTLLDCSLNADF